MSVFEAEIESIAAGGDGVCRRAGMVVFVPRTAPGDLALVRLAAAKSRFARGELVELRRKSPARVEPPCAHYTTDRCGGCQLQHLTYASQLEAKSAIVRDALQRIGRRRVQPPAVHASPAEWRYRRKLTLALRRRGGRWIAGLHPYDDPAAVFDLRDCPITDERVLEVWRAILRAGADLPNARELRAAVLLLDDGASLVVEGGTSWTTHERFFAAVPEVTALWWVPEHGSRRLLADRRSGEVPPSASFAQVNAVMAAALHAHVLERVLRHGPGTVVDAYSGTGATAVKLAERGVSVTAIELDADAAAWCGAQLPEGSRSVAARAEEALPGALPADVVVLNPPRAGVGASVTEVLNAQEAPPRALVYVSCNPATLARDLARLPRYRIASLTSFDMFPQTAHVETVCELIPDEA